MAQVNITIAGKTYRMACDDGQEPHLMALSEQINDHVDGLRESFGDVGEMRLLIMASLMLADDLHDARKKTEALMEDIRALKENRMAIIETVDAAQRLTSETYTALAERIETVVDLLATSGAARDAAAAAAAAATQDKDG